MASQTPKDAAAKAAKDKKTAKTSGTKASTAKAATGEKKPAASTGAKVPSAKTSSSKVTAAKATATSRQKPGATPATVSTVPVNEDTTRTETVWSSTVFGLPWQIVAIVVIAVIVLALILVLPRGCAPVQGNPSSSSSSTTTSSTVPPLPARRLNVSNWKGAIAAMTTYPDIRARLNKLYGKNFVDAQLARLAYDQNNGTLHIWKAPRAGIPFIDTNYGSNLEDGRWGPFQNYTTAGQEFLTWTDGRPALRVGCLNAVDFTQLKKPAASPRKHHVTVRHHTPPRHRHKPKPKPKHCTNGTPGTGLTSPGTPGDPLGYR